MAEITCAQCGADLPPKRKRYCSNRCQKAAERKRYRAKRVPMVCDHCGGDFMGRRWGPGDAEHKRRYCSDECQGEAKRNRYGLVCDHHGWTGRVSCPRCAEERSHRQAERENAQATRQIMLRDRCAYCGEREVGIDHITPSCIGGHDEWENWTACCQRCNGQKGTLPLLGFLLWRQIAPVKAALDERAKTIQSLRPPTGVGGARTSVS